MMEPGTLLIELNRCYYELIIATQITESNRYYKVLYTFMSQVTGCAPRIFSSYTSCRSCCPDRAWIELCP
jgi:hypothetical protein